jgi:hypothetical protein
VTARRRNSLQDFFRAPASRVEKLSAASNLVAPLPRHAARKWLCRRNFRFARGSLADFRASDFD